MKNPFLSLIELFKPDNRRTYIYPGRTAGQRVTEETALTYSAVWRAVNLLSESIACLPWTVKKRTRRPDGKQETEQLFNHPAAPLLDLQANNEIDAFNFKQVMMAHALTWGNGYAEIEFDRSNRPIALHGIAPSRVTADRDESGELFYKVMNRNEPATELPLKNVFHLKGLGFDGVMGYSPIAMAARSIGMGLAVEQFGADFFSNGAHAGGVLSHPQELSNNARDILKQSLIEATSGRNKHAPLVLEEGMTWTQITIPPDDAQFLETRKFNIAEVARWYGIPLHKMHEMDKSTFNNIEQQNIEFVTGSLLSWVKRLESEANIKLISRAARPRTFTKMNMNGMLRGDTESRGNWYSKMHTMGVYTVNRILELEDENPIGPAGDKHLVQLNLTTLDRVGVESENNQAIEIEVDEPASGADLSAAKNTAVAVMANKIVSRQQQRINEALTKKMTPEKWGAFSNKFVDQTREHIARHISDYSTVFNCNLDNDRISAASAVLTDMMAIDLQAAYDETINFEADQAAILEYLTGMLT